MPLTEDHVREALKQVIDPELFVNIVDLGLIYNVEFQPHQGGESSNDGASSDDAEPLQDVMVEMTMTSPMCPAGPQLVAGSKSAVAQLDGVGDVEVKIVLDPPWSPDKMTDDARDQLGIF